MRGPESFPAVTAQVHVSTDILQHQCSPFSIPHSLPSCIPSLERARTGWVVLYECPGMPPFPIAGIPAVRISHSDTSTIRIHHYIHHVELPYCCMLSLNMAKVAGGV
jgi:hypothetical protein